MDFGGQGRTVGARSAAEGMDRRFFIAARCGLYLLMGTVMACARVLGNGAPFGMALVACSGAGISGVFSLLGGLSSAQRWNFSKYSSMIATASCLSLLSGSAFAYAIQSAIGVSMWISSAFSLAAISSRSFFFGSVVMIHTA